ncbi:hypothetical protein GGI11_002903 [Coemansia sp. RSA 2049]|nr:hypothetical protein GGI11_002903 [Coemansia sp. RSA 2049]
MSEDGFRNSTDTSPSRLSRIMSKLSIARTPSRPSSLRSRRGLPTTQELEIQVESLKLDAQHQPKRKQQYSGSAEPPDEIADSSSSVSRTTAYPRQPIQAESLRKRERIAELRQRRLNNFDDLFQQEEEEQREERRMQAQSGAAIVVSPALSSQVATAVENGTPTPASASASASARHGRNAAVAKPQPVSPATDKFFDNPELNLLLQEIDVGAVQESLDGEKVEAASAAAGRRPSENGQQEASVTPSQRNAALAAKDSKPDFAIDIPSTSLSPVFRRGLTMLQRRRSRTAAAQPLQQHGRGGSKDTGASYTKKNKRSETVVAEGGEAAAADGEKEVLAKIDAERAKNAELRKELDKLNGLLGALTRVVLADQAVDQAVAMAASDEKETEYPPLFAE